MGAIVTLVLIFFILAAALGAVAFVVYRRQLRRAKGIERGLKMVPIIIHLPPPSDDTEGGSRDVREVMREKTSQAEVLYNLIAGTAQSGFKSQFYGQRHIALELVATNGLIHFYAAVPVALVSVVEQAILTAYPGAHVEEVEDHNIFNQEGRIAATMGGEIMLKSDTAYPISTFKQLDRDPMEAILNTLGGMQDGDGAGIQIMLRPANPGWVKQSIKLAYKRSKSRHIPMSFTARDFAMAAIRPPQESDPTKPGHDLTELEKNAITAIEEKTQHPGYETLIRVVVSTASVARSQTLIRDISNAFSLFDAPGHNGFKFLPAVDSQGLVTAFIFRFFPPEVNSMVLNSVELATLYHLPDKQFTPSTGVERQQSKQVDGPTTLAKQGLLFGYNEFRGVRKEIRLSDEDRRRHTYILGQTGVGKSTMLENLAVQDMRNGGGFAFIDPHGETAEKLLSMVPKERAEDVVYFNPADTDYPLGLNLFEFDRPEQKDFLIQETIGMLTKLYDPNGTGVIGPRFEQWYRNAALTLMSDPNGSTFIEIPKVFSDTEYLKRKFRYLKDPTVIEFWTKEMGQTSDYHKSEMLGYFVSKFGAFQQNEMMRNIIGQTKSAFDIRDIMDNKKILIVNLSKGRVGELNSRLLGMIFVIKIQAAAMARADMNELDRKDFSLYVDEFQNFSTDSFATILSEARKYRLNLIVANQFIGQLSTEIRDAVFGNVGTIIAHRMGPEDAEFMTKQFAPVFDTRDLVNIPNYHSVMRLMNGGLPSQPFSMADLPPLGQVNLELGKAMIQLSSAKYGVSRAQVEADIFARLSGKLGATDKPVTGGTAGVAGSDAGVTSSVAAAPVAPAVAPPVVPAPAPLPNPEPVPAPAPQPAAPVDPSHLSFKDITGKDASAPAPVPEPAPATLPLPVATPAPVPVQAPAPALAPMPAPTVAPVSAAALTPVAVVAPTPIVETPAPLPVAPTEAPVAPVVPTVEAVVAPAPEPGPVVEAPTVSVLESVALEPAVATAPPIAVAQAVPVTDTSIHEIPLIPETPSVTVPTVEAVLAPPLASEVVPVVEPDNVQPALVPAPEPDPEPAPAPVSEPSIAPVKEVVVPEPIAVEPVVAPEPVPEAIAPTPEAPAPKINTEHHAKHKTGRPDAPTAKAVVADEPVTPAAPIAPVVAVPKVGRPHHVTKHKTGLPTPVQAVVTPVVPAAPVTPAPVIVEVPAEADVAVKPTTETAKPDQKPRKKDRRPKRMPDAPVEQVVVEPNEDEAPSTAEEAQADIQKLIDPGNHLHLFPAKTEPKIDPIELEQAKFEAASSETPVAAPVAPEAEVVTVPVEEAASVDVAPAETVAEAAEEAPVVPTEPTTEPTPSATPTIAELVADGSESVSTPVEDSVVMPEPATEPVDVSEPAAKLDAPQGVITPVAEEDKPVVTPEEQEKIAAAAIADAMRQASAALTGKLSTVPETAAKADSGDTNTLDATASVKAAPEKPAVPEAPVIPDLAPGEVYVDDDGNVHTG